MIYLKFVIGDWKYPTKDTPQKKGNLQEMHVAGILLVSSSVWSAQMKSGNTVAKLCEKILVWDCLMDRNMTPVLLNWDKALKQWQQQVIHECCLCCFSLFCPFFCQLKIRNGHQQAVHESLASIDLFFRGQTLSLVKFSIHVCFSKKKHN